LVLKAFMSMDRAVAIVGPDGKLLLPNLIFDQLFGDAELLDRINRDAGANRGRSDRQITLSDGRAFWVETIPMEDGWLISAYNMTERSAKVRTDTVTKLGNTLMFLEQLSALVANPDRVGVGAAILAIDLTHFKAINETLGRDIGDGFSVMLQSGFVRRSDAVISSHGSKATSSASSSATNRSLNRRLRLQAGSSI
jgi:hypothetical protein